jgi:hypothetical protein
MTDDLRFAKWDEWLETIKTEVTSLVVNRHIFWEVGKMIEANSKLQKSSSFYAWMGNVYVSDAVMGVRRQLDTHKDCISLAKLLREIIATPTVLSRARYLHVYLENSGSDDVRKFLEKRANAEFDTFAGKGSDHADVSRVERDSLELQAIGETIKHYGDRKVAHLDRSRIKHLPTFNELNECIDCIERIFEKYMLAFRAISYTTLPTWTYDWKVIFAEAWEPRSKNRKVT